MKTMRRSCQSSDGCESLSPPLRSNRDYMINNQQTISILVNCQNGSPSTPSPNTLPTSPSSTITTTTTATKKTTNTTQNRSDSLQSKYKLRLNDQQMNTVDHHHHLHSKQIIDQQETVNKDDTKHRHQRHYLIHSDSHHQHHHHHHHSHHSHHHHHNHRTMELVFRNITLYEPCKVKSINSKSRESQCKTSTGNGDQTITIDNNGPNEVNCGNSDTNCSSSISSSSSSASSSEPTNRRILDDISGYAKPGQVLGIMGPSGSGKSSLLNVLSGRLKANQGCITLNGETLNKRMKRKINYVLQHDIFLPDLTLRQTLKYNALLRLPESMSYSQKMKQVDNIINLLNLDQCKDTIIGDNSVRGLSGGEKKRTNIACELLSNPSVMLLDEPTSGLDSSTALGIMKFLKEYAMKERKTVILSIHQPSSQIFYLLDKLLLLSNGNLAYFGDSHSVVPFFSSIGFEITPNYNPADFMMERIKGSQADQEKIISAARQLCKLPVAQRSRPPSLSSSSSPSSHRIKASSIDHHNHENHHFQSDHPRRHHQHQDSLLEQHHQTDSQCDEDETDREAITPPNSEYQHVDDHDRTDGDTEEPNPLWTDGQESADTNDTKTPGSTEIRVLIDPCKKLTKIYTKVANDDDSGRSSWTETDRLSNATFSFSSLTTSTDEMYTAGSGLSPSSRYSSTGRLGGSETYAKWPTSFWTQFKVLTQRNFQKSKSRMLSKLNWIQAIVLGVITGLIWFQVPRQETYINDIRGWMFFATSYWQLVSLFGTLVSIPPEREVVNKERASGCYRLSAYYLAKPIGDLPSIVALPTAFYIISYPMFSFYSVTLFLVQWFFFIFNSVVAQTIGFVIGVTTSNLEISMTISALYSMSTNLFGGFYSAFVPSWLTWARYLSIVHYAFQNMQIIELNYGPQIKCSPKFSRFPSCLMRNETFHEGRDLFISKDELMLDIKAIGETTGLMAICFNTLMLIAFLVFFQLFGYLTLRYFRKHQ